MFFDFFNSCSGLFGGFGTLIAFLWSCWISAALGAIIISVSFLKIWKAVLQKVFALTIVASLNAFLFLIFITLCIEKIVGVDGLWQMYLFVNAVIYILAQWAIKKNIS